jgi:hypothetical protein
MVLAIACLALTCLLRQLGHFLRVTWTVLFSRNFQGRLLVPFRFL